MSPTARNLITVILVIALIVTAGLAVYVQIQVRQQSEVPPASKPPSTKIIARLSIRPLPDEDRFAQESRIVLIASSKPYA